MPHFSRFTDQSDVLSFDGSFLCSFQVKTGKKVMCMKKVIQLVLQAAEIFLDILECVQMPLVGLLINAMLRVMLIGFFVLFGSKPGNRM